MNKRIKKERSDDMYRAILTLKDVDECKKFFDDLCTVTELQAMEQRFQVAALLHEGYIYNEILEKTGASSASASGSGRISERLRPARPLVRRADGGRAL